MWIMLRVLEAMYAACLTNPLVCITRVDHTMERQNKLSAEFWNTLRVMFVGKKFAYFFTYVENIGLSPTEVFRFLCMLRVHSTNEKAG